MKQTFLALALMLMASTSYGSMCTYSAQQHVTHLQHGGLSYSIAVDLQCDDNSLGFEEKEFSLPGYAFGGEHPIRKELFSLQTETMRTLLDQGYSVEAVIPVDPDPSTVTIYFFKR